MRQLRGGRSLFLSVIMITGMLASPVAASAATPSSGLSGKVGRPGTSWTDSVAVAPGAVVNVLIAYTNENASVGQKFVLLRDTLPTGASFNTGSAYLFTKAVPTGAQQADTLTTSGISTGALKPGETAMIQFQMTMPSATSLACGKNVLVNRADGASRTGNKTYATSNNIIIKRDCTLTPPPAPAPAPTPTPTPPAAPTPTTSVAIVAIDASVNTTNNTYNYPATPQVAAAHTTTPVPAATVASSNTNARPVASADKATDSKTLVNTGPGSILVLVIVASLIGFFGSRFMLYRLLGA